MEQDDRQKEEIKKEKVIIDYLNNITKENLDKTLSILHRIENDILSIH